MSFKFRLEKVLEYRRLEESWALEAYRDARAARLEVDASIVAIQNYRQSLLQESVLTLEGHRALERVLLKTDSDEREARIALTVVESEEQRALENWQDRKREVQAIEKLRERAEEEWQLEESRREQNELDEWAVTRRAA